MFCAKNTLLAELPTGVLRGCLSSLFLPGRLPLRPAMFQLIEEKAQRMLVGSVRCAQRRAARLDAAPA